MRVVILGAGNVGTALARALARTHHPVELLSARRFVAEARPHAGLWVLAVRDGEVTAWAERLARAGSVSQRGAVVHVAGALGPEALAPLRPTTAGVGQAHPAVSLPAARAGVELRGAVMTIGGDPVAVRRAATLARAIGLIPLERSRFDRPGYHTACALAANGAAALASAAGELLGAAGIPARDAQRILGPLLRTVAENLDRFGLDGSLSGPIRRGEAVRIVAHLASIRRLAPETLPLYLALAERQLATARRLADAPPEGLATVADVLARERRRADRE
ncbi:MAG: DUF2520 domain-containing protein [Polyangiaceae bacterium]|nr:DUF2520 domain-containing protein [Polyangiaceae bacterium]